MSNDNALGSPWSLHFDRDGTEDFGIICDAEGNDIAASHVPCTRIGDRTFETGTFWLPEKQTDAVPRVARQLRAMTAAPKLLEALEYLLQQTVGMDLRYGIWLTEGEEEARAKALAAIAEAVWPESETANAEVPANQEEEGEITF